MPVAGGVVEQPPVGEAFQGVGGDFFEVKPSTGGEHPGGFGHRGAPVRDVMNDPEVEHRVVAVVVGVQRGPKVSGAALEQGDPVTLEGEPLAGPVDHRRVQVDRVDPGGAESLQHQLRAVARSAADFEGSAAREEPAAEAQQYQHLVETLKPPPRWRVDQGCLRPIHQHCRPLSLGGRRP